MMSFPAELTAAEIALKKKFEWHLRVKKTLQSIQQKSQMKPEAESSRVMKRLSSEQAAKTTEEAKRLVKSGVMTIEKKASKNTFKRSKLLDKKIKEGEGGTTKFQSYPSMTQKVNASISIDKPTDKHVTPLNNSFISGGSTMPGVGGGRTVTIRGFDLTENMLEQAFKQFGTLVKVHVEDRRRTASVEYESNDEAEKAISQMHGCMLNGQSLQVSMMARKTQPNTIPKRNVWSEMVDGPNPKREKPADAGRTMVKYDDDM